jgi:hypothetical protein
MTLVTPRPTDAPPADAEALFKEARRRRRQRRMAWLLAVVLVTTAVVVVVSQAGPTKTAPRRGAQTVRPSVPVVMSSSIVGWTSTSNVVVLSSAGQIQRTLASNISIFAPGLPNVSVAPDGTVYFESAEPAPYNRELGPGDQIWRCRSQGVRSATLRPGRIPK